MRHESDGTLSTNQQLWRGLFTGSTFGCQLVLSEVSQSFVTVSALRFLWEFRVRIFPNENLALSSGCLI